LFNYYRILKFHFELKDRYTTVFDYNELYKNESKLLCFRTHMHIKLGQLVQQGDKEEEEIHFL